MRRLIALFAALILVIGCAVPALAAGFGISPAEVEFEVPSDGSAKVQFLVYDFTGDLKISLENIPLKVEPTTVPVTASAQGTRIVLTFYGDESLGSKIYKGKIRFLAMTGGMVAMGIKVRATVTNLVEGETPVLAPIEESQPPAPASPAPTQPTPATSGVVVLPAPSSPAPPPPVPPSPTQPTTELPIPLLAGIAAGTLIVITLIIVVARRKRY